MKMARANVTQAVVREYFEYREGGLYWKKNSSQRVKMGERFGYVRLDGYRGGGFLGNPWFEHRLIWLFHNVSLLKNIDHIDKNKSNNRIENLRDNVTPHQNSQNKSNHKNNTSGIRGVSLLKRTRKDTTYRYWAARWSDQEGKPHMKTFPHTLEGMLRASAHFQKHTIKF